MHPAWNKQPDRRTNTKDTGSICRLGAVQVATKRHLIFICGNQTARPPKKSNIPTWHKNKQMGWAWKSRKKLNCYLAQSGCIVCSDTGGWASANIQASAIQCFRIIISITLAPLSTTKHHPSTTPCVGNCCEWTLQSVSRWKTAWSIPGFARRDPVSCNAGGVAMEFQAIFFDRKNAGNAAHFYDGKHMFGSEMKNLNVSWEVWQATKHSLTSSSEWLWSTGYLVITIR